MDAEGNVTENEDGNREGRVRSAVWLHFESVSKKDFIAKCNYCEKRLSYRSPSNLKKHLLRKHDDILVKDSDDEGEKSGEEITYLEEEEDVEQEADISLDRRKILRSGAWEYFEVLDEEQKLATCTLCREQFSYRTTSTNLAKHLKRRHCIEFEKVVTENEENADNDEEYTTEKIDILDETDVSDEDADNDNMDTKPRRKSSLAWRYFSVADAARRRATCRLCGTECSYLTSVSNLLKHIRRKHAGDCSYKPRQSSRAWRYFSVADAARRRAACRLCGVHCSYTSISNLLKHIRRKHASNGAEGALRSPVWLYFRRVDRDAKLAVCLICKKQLSHMTSITNLKKHLERKHPGLQLEPAISEKKMLLSSDGQLYEIEETASKQEMAVADEDQDQDQTEPLEMNAIYLSDYEGEVTLRKPEYEGEVPLRKPEYEAEVPRRKTEFEGEVPRSKAKKRRRRTLLDETTGIAETASSDDEITVQKRYVRKKQDSLDQFGKYLVSLLKQLPKELSNQLQADFVKQVLSAQLTADTDPHVSSQTHADVDISETFDNT